MLLLLDEFENLLICFAAQLCMLFTVFVDLRCRFLQLVFFFLRRSVAALFARVFAAGVISERLILEVPVYVKECLR